LRSGEDDIELPVVEANLLTADTAHAVDDEECVGAHLLHKLAQCFELTEHAGRGIDVCNRDDLVALLLQRLLNLVELRSVADGSLELSDLGAVCLKAVGERVGKVACVQDEDLITRLGQVRGDLVPAECAGAGDDKGLSGGVGCLEELA
jgi:hypothetical protein